MKTNIITYGCQMNEYDTHLVRSELVSLGAEFVDHWREADFVLVNTCAVRGKPVEKVRSLLGELRKEMHKEVEDRVIGEIAKTLTNHTVSDIEKVLLQ
ncbi:baeRF12 domain-containing protein [Staphylococcus aureus]|uniref:baeRF12 domain-containing protein n=1 Tax=Staphylococcus aureus TaxID=1280 RepID=UPI002109D81E|nr:host attachment protein [Staphylococcus aureus]